MGFKVRKSMKIAPGVRLNVGKKSSGISVGGKYGGVSFNSKTGARARVSAPGTGVSYSTKIGSTSKKTSTKKSTTHNTENNNQTSSKPQKLASKVSYKIAYVLFMILAILCFILGVAIAEGAAFFIIAIVSIVLCLFYRKIYKNYGSYLEP